MKDWNDLQFLLALSRAGNLPAAAELLDVNRTTVARRIESLEAELGVHLVVKVGRDLALTPAGHEAVSAAELVDGELHQLERQVYGRDQSLSGLIRITLTEGIGCLIAPQLTRFQTDHPDITLEISASNAPEDLELMEADVALRFTTKPPETLIGRRIGRPRLALYVAHGLAQQIRSQPSVDYITTTISEMLRGSDTRLPLKTVMRTNSVFLSRELVLAGKGVAWLPCYMAEGDKRLVRVSDTRQDHLPEIWLLYHPRLRSQLRIRRFVEFIIETFESLSPVLDADA